MEERIHASPRSSRMWPRRSTGAPSSLDCNKEVLRRDIALLDDLHEETRTAIGQLDAHIEAGKEFAGEFRAGQLTSLKQQADTAAGSDAMLAAQSHQDATQALDRLERRAFYLQQARQIGIQQLPQIHIVQSVTRR